MQEKDERMVLIGGGVGPMAGVALHQRMIEETVTNGSDQDHLEVLHISRSPVIGDRTDFLTGSSTQNPVSGMLRSFRMAALGLVCEGREAVAGIPCNTFHAARILLPFREGIEAENMPMSLLNMLEETAEYLQQNHPKLHKLGLLSTTGTRRSGVYGETFEPYGYELIEVPEEEQEELHEAIYHRSWGLKAVSPPSEEAVQRVRTAGSRLVEAGAEAIILGCTELPLAVPEGVYAGVPYIDPVTALARALIREAAPEKLRPRP